MLNCDTKSDNKLKWTVQNIAYIKANNWAAFHRSLSSFTNPLDETEQWN